MKTSHVLAAVLAAIIALVVVSTGLGWFSSANNLAKEKVFAPAHEKVRRDTYEQSRSYNAGTIQNIRDAQSNYITAPPDRRAGLGSVIIQQYADYPDESLPRDLRVFMVCLREHQGQAFDCSPGASQ